MEIERERKLSILHDVFEEINDNISGKMPNKETREFIKQSILEKTDFLDEVICDESNNPPDTIDDEVIIARCIWNSNSSPDSGFSYLDLAFGNPERTYKYLLTFR